LWIFNVISSRITGVGGGFQRPLCAKKGRGKIGELNLNRTGGKKIEIASENNLSIRNLKKKFGKFYALDGVDLDLEPGKITCILGHNGAGKTTLINTILGLLSPTEGNIFYKGEDIHQNPDILNSKVGYCSADICLYDNFTVSEFMMYICFLIGVPKPREHVKELLEKCNLQKYSSQIIEKLSGGTKKRVSLACSLVGEPNILFLDEPSSGVDVANRKEIWSFLLSFISEERIILMTTH